MRKTIPFRRAWLRRHTLLYSLLPELIEGINLCLRAQHFSEFHLSHCPASAKRFHDIIAGSLLSLLLQYAYLTAPTWQMYTIRYEISQVSPLSTVWSHSVGKRLETIWEDICLLPRQVMSYPQRGTYSAHFFSTMTIRGRHSEPSDGVARACTLKSAPYRLQ